MVKGAPRRKGAPAAGAASASAPPLTSAAQATTYSPAPPSPSPSSDSSSGLDDDRPPAGGGGASARSGSVEAAELDEDYDAQAEAITCQCQWGDCQDTFTDLTTLIDHITEKHVGSHKSTYTCEWTTCPRRGLSQTSRFALISHMRTHTGEKPFICILPECPKSFTRSDALAKHMRLQHNIEPPAPGRGGSRKRKRGMAGVDEALTLGHSASSSSTPLHHASTTNSTTGGQATAGAGAASSSTTVSQPPSSIPNATGFNTFKLDRSAMRRGAAAAAAAAAAAGASSSNGVGGEANGVSMVGGLTESKRGANGRPRRGKAGEAAMQIPVTVLEVQRLPRGASGAGAAAGNGVGMENGFGGEGVEEVTLDDLPVYLQKEYDEKTGLIHGRSVYQVLYLLMKARYRWALEQNEALSEELKEARIEAKKEKDEKETVLDEFLRRSLGDDATELTTLPPPPPSVAAALQAQQEQLQLQQQISQDASTTAPSIEMSYSAMNGVSAGAPVQHNGSVAFRV